MVRAVGWGDARSRQHQIGDLWVCPQLSGHVLERCARVKLPHCRPLPDHGQHELTIRAQLSGGVLEVPSVVGPTILLVVNRFVHLHCGQDNPTICAQLSRGVPERVAALLHCSQNDFAVCTQLAGVLEMPCVVLHGGENDVAVGPQLVCRVP
tara:strand:+ start:176 stop:631 length:456 start_codon:yes stop_codon:yes gene_type:complete